MPITYDDLRICAALKRESDDLKEQIERMRSVLEGRPRILTKWPKGVRREMDDMVIALLELEDIYKRRVCKWARHVQVVEAMIDRLANPDQRRVMRLRYVVGLTWEEVAGRAHFDERWCRRICDNALAKLGIEKLARNSPLET